MTIREKLCLNKDELIELYLSGASAAALGRKMECNGGYIWTMLKEWGVEIRQTKKVEPNTEAILALHEQGKSAYAINQELGLPHKTAERALAKAGISIAHRKKGREKPLVDDKDVIIARYQAGEGIEAIGKDYNCQGASILRLLRRAGVETRSLRDYAYSVDESFFDVIDTEQKAYILGFWMADGCNMSQIPVVRMAIADRDILEEMCRAMKFEGVIRELQPRDENHQTQWSIDIGSRRMSNALTKLGCVRGKTYVAQFPSEDQVPAHLHRHLIRGWMDGDGTLTSNQKRGYWHSRIVGTEAVCRGISAACNFHLGFTGNVCPVLVGDRHTTWAFTVGAQDQLAVYLDWLYRDATIFLARKRDKYLEFQNVGTNT